MRSQPKWTLPRPILGGRFLRLASQGVDLEAVESSLAVAMQSPVLLAVFVPPAVQSPRSC